MIKRLRLAAGERQVQAVVEQRIGSIQHKATVNQPETRETGKKLGGRHSSLIGHMLCGPCRTSAPVRHGPRPSAGANSSVRHGPRGSWK